MCDASHSSHGIRIQKVVCGRIIKKKTITQQRAKTSMATPQALQPGHDLLWYTVEKVLGQGGFGITYLARDNNLERQVAIKEYLPQDFASRESDATVRPKAGESGDHFKWGLTRFMQEARTLAQFKHPNIVRVYSVFEDNQTAYMVMEYERGEELEQVYRASGTLSEEYLKSVFIPIMKGLELFHGPNFIHRDIKPANIFIRENGEPVLLDFGSARKTEQDGNSNLTCLVTQGYAPFEQHNSEVGAQGPWTDIYAIAACLYRGVTSKLPLDALVRGGGLLTGRADPLEPVAELAGDGYSAEFLQAIDLGLRFRPDERPQSIAEWMPYFVGGGVGQDDDATVLRFPEPAAVDQAAAAVSKPSFVKASGNKNAAIAAGVVLALAGAGGAFFMTQSEPDQVSLPVAVEQVEPKVAKVEPVPVVPKGEAQLPQPPQTIVIPDVTSSVEEILAALPLVAKAYQETEAIDPLSPDVKELKDQVVKGYMDAAITVGRLSLSRQRAETVLREGLVVAPGDENLTSMLERFERDAEAGAVPELLSRAKGFASQGAISEPRGANAIELYQRVLIADPDNITAEDAMRGYAAQLVQQAEALVMEKQFEQAALKLKAAQFLYPDLPELKMLKEHLALG